MKIFLDTGNVEEVRKAVDTGLIDGVTTNPTHIMKTGQKFNDVVKEIAKLVPGHVSAECMSESTEGMIEEAKNIASIAPNVIVKIPMNEEGLKAVPILEKEEDIRTNVTMIFSSTQALLAMKAGATYASIVISRLDKIGNEGDILIRDAAMFKKLYKFNTEILAGSLKTQNHLLHAFRSGIDVITIPGFLFFQMFEHPLTDQGLSTFAEDWKKVPK